MSDQELIKEGRDFLHNYAETEEFVSDQKKKLPQPPLVKEAMTSNIIDLPTNYEDLTMDNDFMHVINARKSHRVYTDETMSLLQLSYLLWASQGVKEIRGKSYATLRTVPSGGARHGFETYMVIRKVEGLEPGAYHYLPMEHKIEFLGSIENIEDKINVSLCGQAWACKASVVFYYALVAYRCEWRYGIHAHRPLLIDAGHIGQNIYLACTALGLGTCAIAAFDNAVCDPMFGIDGEEEFTVYTLPVGTISEKNKQAEDDFYAFVKEQGL